jgi:hypothetical protein
VARHDWVVYAAQSLSCQLRVTAKSNFKDAGGCGGGRVAVAADTEGGVDGREVGVIKDIEGFAAKSDQTIAASIKRRSI